MKPLLIEFLYQRHVDISFGVLFEHFGIFLADFLDRQFEIFSGRIGLQWKIVLAEVFFEHFAVLDFHILRQNFHGEFFVGLIKRHAFDHRLGEVDQLRPSFRQVGPARHEEKAGVGNIQLGGIEQQRHAEFARY